MFWQRAVSIMLFASAFSFIVNALPDAASDALSQIPPCGLECISAGLPLIGCGLLDVECQCNSRNSTTILQPCLMEKCTVDQTFGMSSTTSFRNVINNPADILRLQATICNRPHDSYTNAMRITAYVTGIIPVIAVAMRFASRWIGGTSFWWDDWIHLVSAILCIPLCVVFELNIDSGIGQHLWDLTYPRVFAIGRWTYIATILWGVEMLLLKYSILCLYLRIFPHVWLKRAVVAFMAFTACFVVPLLFAAAIRCNPVRAQWDIEAAKTAKCLDWLILLKLTVVYEVIAEIILFAIPVPVVLKLQMATAKKIQLIIFFGLGLLIIAVSIARVPFLEGVVDQSDQTYTVVGTSMSTFIASGLGHFCAAVPTVQALIRYATNGFKDLTQASSTYKNSRTCAHSDRKKPYESLEDSNNASNYSGDTLKVSKQRSKKSSKDPFRLSTQQFSRFEVEDNVLPDDQFMELRPVDASVTKHKQSADGQKENPQGHDSVDQPGAIVASSPIREDSSSDKAILEDEYLKGT